MNKEYIKDYIYRSGDSRVVKSNYTEDDEYGFITYDVIGDAVFIYNCYGDGVYWDIFAEELAKRLNKSKIVFFTSRNPKSFERKYGYKVEKYIMSKEV